MMPGSFEEIFTTPVIRSQSSHLMLLAKQAEVAILFQVWLKPWAIFVACLVVLPACAPATSDSSAEDRRTLKDGGLSRNDSQDIFLQQGKTVYLRNCQTCHGVNGDGKGAYANVLAARPRDFTAGVFKFRSTRSGALPTDADLMRTVTHGIPRSGMPTFAALSEEERLAVITYIKSFSRRFDAEPMEEPLVIPLEPTKTFDTVQKGQQLFVGLGCVICHGESGNGGGALAFELVDDTGSRIMPADLTDSSWKGGCTGRDLYRTIMTGLDGTPMPSFGEQLAPGEAWPLVHYIQSQAREKISGETLSGPSP